MHIIERKDILKHEWRKKEKSLYLPKEEAELIEVPAFKFLMLSGKGNPNTEAFSKRVEVLYKLSYAVRMMPKKGYTPEGYYEYTVYPLEGVWDLTDEGKQSDQFDKDELVYTIMIRQPNFVTPEVIELALDSVRKKKENPLLDEVTFATIEEGLSVQMMHRGPYDDEPKTFEQMKKFIMDNHLEIKTLKHREIYISDARKTEQSKLKTVLRYRVCQ